MLEAELFLEEFGQQYDLDERTLSETSIIDIPADGITFHEVEKQTIDHTLRMTDWNRNQAARMLKISRPRLLRKIEKHGLGPPK